MDQLLQNLRRQAQLNPSDIDLLWKYTRHLERAQGVGEPGPLYAVLTDGETCGGPCMFSGTVVPYNESDNKITLYGKFMDEWSTDDVANYFSYVRYAWVITKFVKQAGEAIWKDCDWGRDSISDAVTSAQLSLFKNMSVKIIKFPSDPRCSVDEDGCTLDPELETEIWNAYRAYRRTKDDGRVRVSVCWATDTIDLLLGAFCDEPVQECFGKEVDEQILASLPYPPRQLLVQRLNGGEPFKAILYKQQHRSYTNGYGRYLLCKSCLHKPSFRCSKKPDEQYDHLTYHKPDEHLLLEIDGVPIANEDEFQDWLDENAYKHLEKDKRCKKS